MNFQITRIRLASIGPEPARYDPLDLDFVDGDGTGPADTVLFLPNTGGKTVLLRLIFSVLHPPVVEKIGSEEVARRSKNLLGYVLEGDTAHIVVEWRRVREGRFADDEVLVTGLVAEWRGGRPTANPADLVRLWYTVRGSVDALGADRLTFDAEVQGDNGPVRRRLPLRRFREQLEEIGRGEGKSRPLVTATEIQRDWIAHLDELGLDRALFRYQGEMNHNEAGASAIARFSKDLDFIEFFLSAVMDPAELAVLDREFEEVADKVRRYPEYERRMRFEEAARTELEQLVSAVDIATTARAEAQAARASALDVLAQFAAGALAAAERERAERQRFREQDSEARRLAAAAERLRDEWREYRRLGASLWLVESKASYDAAQRQMQRADLDVRAWAIAEDLVRLREASAEVQVLDTAYAAELERLRPLQLIRDEAGLALATRLAADAILASTEEAMQKDLATRAKARAEASRKDERDALVEAARLDATREAGESRLAEVVSRRARLVGEGYLEVQERADEARDRELVAAKAALSRLELIEGEIGALETERVKLDEADRTETTRRSRVQQQRDRVAVDIEHAEGERARLAAAPLVVELAESTAFDLELVGPAIAERLLGRVKEADASRIDLELRGIEDRRALRGLDATGLLPPPAEVEVALARLASAGITGAIPGTRYIAEAIAAGQRNDVVARRADLVGGIVLTDPTDLSKARSIFEAASLNPSMIIAVGPAAELADAETATNDRATFVIPPADSVWDRTAGGAERAQREARLATLEAERAALDARASGARSLAEALARHAATYPAGWLAAHVAERDALAGELARLDADRARRDVRRSEIAVTIQRLRDEASKLRKSAREAERRAVELGRLADEEADTADIAAALERHRAEASAWRGLAEAAARAASLADAEVESTSQNALDQRAAVERIRRELSTIALAQAVVDPRAEEARTIAAGSDLAELRLRFAELDRRLAGETSSSDVAARRNAAIKIRDRLHAVIESHPQAVRERAATLLAAPEAGDLAGRRAAAQRADVEAASARTAERDAYATREQAQNDLDEIEEEIRTSRRSVKVPEARAPRDRHEAARLAAEARLQGDATQSQATAAERERTAAREAADHAKSLFEDLSGLATQLRMSLSLPADAKLPSVAPYQGDIETARTTGLETARRLGEAIAAEDRADRAWRKQDGAVRAILAREEFADLAVSDRLYRRLAQSTAETLARDAAELVTDLRASIAVLRAELATLADDVKLATTSLAKSVNKALSYLRLAETRSKMPAGLRDWAGVPFLVIRFEKPPAEELETRLATFVTDVVNRPLNRPTGTTLLLQALERAVGQFSVQILKPNEAFAPIRVPVAELSSPTFSNGQRSTVATALMLMLSELRRQSRSAARGASVGTLLLDNPFGNANAGFLIEVQRTVAAAAGIQLVYTTGIADLNALRHFPNVIALSNDAARRTMRRYVRANPALLELLVPAEDGPGGRLSAARVMAVSNREARGQH